MLRTIHYLSSFLEVLQFMLGGKNFHFFKLFDSLILKSLILLNPYPCHVFLFSTLYLVQGKNMIYLCKMRSVHPLLNLRRFDPENDSFFERYLTNRGDPSPPKPLSLFRLFKINNATLVSSCFRIILKNYDYQPLVVLSPKTS